MCSQRINYTFQIRWLCDGTAKNETIFTRNSISLQNFGHLIKEL